MKSSFLNNPDGKKTIIKQKILSLCINEGEYSIAELSKETNTSIPTVTKLVSELIEEGYLEDLGKMGTSGGRRPSIYGLKASAGYFIGADISRNTVSLAVSNFKGSIIDYQDDIPFTLESTEQSMDELSGLLRKYISKLGIDEDSVLAYGEYICGVASNEKNMLFINVSWGLGMGMVLDGKPHYGKSGFSGEIGHFPLLDNDIICQCGKVGCLETGASGLALHRLLMDKLKEGKASILSSKFSAGDEITLDDILGALTEEDVLTIETLEETGSTLGRAIAGLINIFNPDLVVVGGRLSVAEEYLMLPIKSAINKHSLNIVSKDTVIKFSKLGKKAGPIGACMLSRSHMLGLL